jgi:cytosine/adenosine deaminase-related metal-dependent hydrolase
MSRRTLIKSRFLVAWQNDRHVLLENGELAMEGDRIVYVGPHYDGKADELIDARDQLVCPGFINLHTHMFSPITRSFLEDLGSKRFAGSTTLYEHLPAIRRACTNEDVSASTRFALMELTRTGSTTVVALQTSDKMETVTSGREIAALMGKWGLRGYVCPMHSSGWYYPGEAQLEYSWREERGFEQLEEAGTFVRELEAKWSGRVRGMIGPRQTALCTPDLLRATREMADKLKCPIEIHAAETVDEYHEIKRRHGMTPIQLLRQTGLLAPDLILGHCIYVPNHHLVNEEGNDLELIASAGATVAHCPWIFARRGTGMESFARYKSKGITLGMGTDSFPQDIIAEMRCALVTCKLLEGRNDAVTISDVFYAATVGGAKALGRDDLGRLAPGCQADIITIDMNALAYTPVRDPLKNLVYSGHGTDVHTVIVAGETKVRAGKTLFCDEQEVKQGLQQAAERAWARMKDLEEMSPLSIPRYQACECHHP